MINILIRAHRPEEFSRCVESIKPQTFRDIKIITAVDGNRPAVEATLKKSGMPFQIIEVPPATAPYGWNLYCNTLKDQVTDGWFFYLDDDDCLVDKFCLSVISYQLSTEHGTVCQFLRRRKPKPAFNRSFWMEPSDIVRGRIGGSCIFLHHTHKNLADWDGNRAADYRFIRDVRAALPLKFIPHVVVKALNGGRHGK